jgi:hypothetical protein
MRTAQPMIAVVLGATPLPMRDSAAAMGRTIRGLTRACTATCQDSPDRICPTTTLPKRRKGQQRQQLPLGLGKCGGSLQQGPRGWSGAYVTASIGGLSA